MEVAARVALRAAAAALHLGFSTPAFAEGEAAQKVLRVATSGDYAPFSFEVPSAAGAKPTSAGGGEPTSTAGADLPSEGRAEPGLDGFDVAVAKRFAHDRGYRLELVRFRWPELARELAAGSFDVAMSGVTVRPERLLMGRTSVPVAATQAVAVAWNVAETRTLAELDRPGRRIAVNAGGHLEKVAHATFRRAQVIPIADNAAVRMSLLDRTVDAVVTDNFEQPAWTASEPGFLTLGPLSNDRKAYLLPPGRADLARELDGWLLDREKDGSLRELRARYFRGPDGSVPEAAVAPTADPLSALAAAIRERLALMPFVWEAKKREQRPIEDETQEAAVLDSAAQTVAAEAERAGRGAPDAKVVRDLFRALIEAGKDVQRKLAEEDARRRPGVVRYRPPRERDGAPAEAATNGDVAAEAAAAEATAAAAETLVRQTGPDLARDIRPAIARVTGKIAMLLVAMNEPVTTRTVRRKLSEVLGPDELSADRTEAIAFAIAAISSGNGRTP